MTLGISAIVRVEGLEHPVDELLVESNELLSMPVHRIDEPLGIADENGY